MEKIISRVTVRDFGIIITGKTPSSKEPESFGREYPFITPTDLKENSIYPKTDRFLSIIGKNKLKNYELPPRTVCFTCIGATIGKSCILKTRSFTNQQINSIIVNETKFNPFFIYYLLKTQVNRIRNYAGGAATPIISKNIFSKIEFDIPQLKDQQKIAAILSTYDNVIENNTRRIRILEEMAQALYREWFVHFRFPGHEGVRLVESELGPVPEGWKIVKVTDAIIINPRFTLPKDGIKPFLSMGCLTEDTMNVQSIEYREGNSGSKFQNGDTLFARITPCLENGKTVFIQFLPTDSDIGLGSTEFIVLRSKTLTMEFVYLLSRTDPFRDNAIKSMSGATGRQRVQEECFEKYFIVHPDNKTLDLFEKIIKPIFKSVYTLALKDEVLRHTRDLLLPKLISGEVDVSDLDIRIPEAEA